MGDPVFEALFRDAAMGLVLLSADGTPLAVNPYCREVLPETDAEQALREAVAAVLDEASTAEEPVEVTLRFGVVARLTRLRGPTQDLGAARYVLVIGRAAGYRDVVTGLENRDAGLKRLQQLLVRRSPVRVELVFLDLDGFKGVNDSLGHLVGDEVLRCVAERVVATVRPEDVVVRWGGDEFVVILEDPAEGSATHICARITEALAEPLPTSAGPVVVSASCGCAAGTNGDDAAELLHHADQRMYVSKRRRGNGG